MVDALEGLLEGFNGAQGHVRCFLHILSLVAKSLISHFDACTKKHVAQQDDEEAELASLADALREAQDIEAAWKARGESAGDVEEEGGDDVNDEVDAVGELTEEEREEFEEHVRLVKLALAKVSG